MAGGSLINFRGWLLNLEYANPNLSIGEGLNWPMEYVIYTDESDKDGDYFGNFYGGALVRSTDLQTVIDSLSDRKNELNLYREVKWQKVSGAYKQKYKDLMDTFFDHIADDRIKVRIMFTKNVHVPNLTREQSRNQYHLLYYQFIKHAFGLGYSDAGEPSHIRLNIDQMPRNREANAQFKGHVVALNQSRQFRDARIRIRHDQIAEISSHDHVVSQCLDVVLGAMVFRLNDKHKIKPEGSRTRGKRTIAKESVYKHINARIREIYPNFNVGISTGIQGAIPNRWLHPYRHWLFVPAQHEIDRTKNKP